MKHTSTDSKREDRRVEKTRAALLEALLELMVRKGYDQTTIQDVLDRAGVGRATFYTHYFNKKDLLLRQMSVFRFDVSDASRIPDMTHIFEHVAEHRALYPAMRGTEALDAFLAIARADLLASFESLVRVRFADRDDERVRFCAGFLTGAFLHLLIEWLDDGLRVPAAEMDRRFRELGNCVLSADA